MEMIGESPRNGKTRYYETDLIVRFLVLRNLCTSKFHEFRSMALQYKGNIEIISRHKFVRINKESRNKLLQ